MVHGRNASLLQWAHPLRQVISESCSAPNPVESMPSNQLQTPEPAEKLARIERYLLQDPINLGLLSDAIDLCIEQGRVAAARKYVDSALINFPDDMFLQCRHANVLMAEGQFDDAQRLFESLLLATPDPSLATNLAFIHFRQCRYEQAAATLAPYIAAPLLPMAAVTLYIRALHHVGDMTPAVAAAQGAMARGRADTEFLSAAALLFLDAGQAAEAERLSQAVFALGERTLEALVVGGTVALGHGDLANAADRFEAALAIQADNGRIWYGLGLISLMEQDLENAAVRLKRASELMPTDAGLLQAIGWSLILAHDLAGAQETFEQALSVNRNFSESHGGLAVVFALGGKLQLAEDAIERALRLDPHSLSARYAQMVISGTTTDSARFLKIAGKLLSGRKGLFGESMLDMFAKSRKR
jgi:tetratricopeptide (TPR) repeat protein